jgi:hypothetical protein
VTYSAIAFRLLFSAPSDVAHEDLEVAAAAVLRWNAIYGQQFGAVVVPTNWQAHSVARHGLHPQAELNAQLVDDADIVIALFWHRLGSPTEAAQSGTVEEIERAHEAGAYVAILRCSRAIPQGVDLTQLERLRGFYDEIRSRSLVLEYATDSDLASHVDAILNRAVSRSRGRAEATVEQPPGQAEVWPRIETNQDIQSDARGKVSTRTKYQLVLANTGREAARRVRYELDAEVEGESTPMELDHGRELEALAPRGEARYNLVVTMGTTQQVRCTVWWEDSAGEHENVATLRLF